jgi:DNA polymerase III subunit epsilon
MLPAYVLLDLETTGATPVRDRITEIALIRFEEGVEVARWQTLVNPEAPISPFIQRLTGISDAMVQEAPRFVEIAETLRTYLEGAVLAAHNVRFDYGFLKNEFKRLGITLRQKVLCTVKLSRKLYPQYHSHGLDALIERHQLQCPARHRAMGDTEALACFIAQATRALGAGPVTQAAQELLNGPSLPPGLEASFLDELPDGPGVYLFFGENDLPLYIGKSKNLRTRVLSHFSGDHASGKEMRIGQEIKRVEWIETAGEFGALLLEARLVKQRQPIYNRQLRRERQLCTWRIAKQPDARPLLELVRVDAVDLARLDELYGTYRSKRQAVEALRGIAEANGLCQKALGLESGTGVCFAHQLGRCKGLCAGRETPADHYERLLAAMCVHRLQAWPYQGRIAVREHDAASGRTALHVFDHWCHLATVDSEAALPEVQAGRAALAFDHDTYKLLLRELKLHQDAVLPL